MIRKLLILPLILLFVSCTITKRVHRPGYHIQWRKLERNQPIDKSPSKKEKSTIELSSNEQTEPFVEAEISPTVPRKSTHMEKTQTVAEADQLIAIQPVNNEIVATLNKTVESTLIQTKTKNVTVRKKAIRPIFWYVPPATLKKIGVVFMILGGMTLFGSLLVYLGAFSGNGNGGDWINFFLDLLDISGWFWLLVFILLFILISYLFFLLVLHVLGGPLNGLIVGLTLLAIGIFFYALGERRTPEPD